MKSITFDHTEKYLEDCVSFAGFPLSSYLEKADADKVNDLGQSIFSKTKEKQEDAPVSLAEIAKIIVENTSDLVMITSLGVVFGSIAHDSPTVATPYFLRLMRCKIEKQHYSTLLEEGYGELSEENGVEHPEKDRNLFELALVAMNLGILREAIKHFERIYGDAKKPRGLKKLFAKVKKFFRC